MGLEAEAREEYVKAATSFLSVPTAMVTSQPHHLWHILLNASPSVCLRPPASE